MKKSMLRKDFFMEIRKSMNRFISIFLIVAMGVAFFSGIRASEPDMRLTADYYYDQRNLMDIRVQGTMGLTEDDVEAIRALDGVADAAGGFSADVISWYEESQKNFRVYADMGEKNHVDVIEGRLPEKAGEVLIDAQTLDKHAYKIGDTITFVSGDDSDILDTLTTDTFEIVGIGSSPEYITYDRGSTTIGDGEIDSFALVTADSFSLDVFTKIDVWLSDTVEEVAYTDGYEEKVDRVLTEIEDTVADARCEARYASVKEDAQAELDDAKLELADARAEAESELADARKELEDAEIELADGRQTLEDEAAKLADARKQISDNEAKLSDARNQIYTNEQSLISGWSQYYSGEQEYAKGLEQLNASRAQLDSGWAQYEQGLSEYENQKAAAENELSLAKAQLEQWKDGLGAYDMLQENLTRVTDGLTQVESAIEQNMPQIEAGMSQIDSGLTQLQAGLTQLDGGLVQLQESIAHLNGAIAQYDLAIADIDSQLAAFEGVAEEQLTPEQKAAKQALIENRAQAVTQRENYAGQKTQLDSEYTALQTQKTSLEQEILTLQTQKAELEKSKAELENNRAMLVEKKAQIEAGIAQIEGQMTAEQLNWTNYNNAVAAYEAGYQEAMQGFEAALAELNQGKAELEAGETAYAQGLYTLESSRATLDNSLAQLQSGQAQLDQAKRELQNGQSQLANAKAQLADGQAQIDEARQELTDGEQELADGWKDYEEGKAEAEAEIVDAQKEIDDAQAEIDDLTYPKWYVSDRSVLPGNAEFGDNADRIRAIGAFFPLLFFLIAALISLTTMTRMVEEQRIQIGTLKALGYSKAAIAGKYIFYALTATVGGSIVGVLIGEKILPFIIVNAYKMVYPYMSAAIIPYNLEYALLASLAAVICITLATFFSCYRELSAVPASLMRPEPPKQGKRILLERITPLWKHISFTQKSTLRNLFRYKKRFFMTVFGIGGCMALMVVGYGIKDAIMGITELQYGKLQKYQAMLMLDEDAPEADTKALFEKLDSEALVEDYMSAYMMNTDISSENETWTAFMVVPGNIENIDQYFLFNDRVTGEVFELDDTGVMLAEKTARMLDVEIGDTIEIKTDNFDSVSVTVSGICENYVSHYIYMTPTLYEQVYGEAVPHNSVFVRMNTESEAEQSAVGEALLSEPAVLNVSYMDSMRTMLDDMLGTMDIIIVVLIISAGMLAFIVLYNLNNININERRRELATIKVLGFYDIEVAEYVYRENIYLTLIGVAVGVVLGKILHQFVITTVEIDDCMFGRQVHLSSYIFSMLLTLLFSIIVNVAMFYKLRKIDMVESLKSVE